MHSTAWTSLGAAVAIHQRIVDRLVQRVYDQPLINNVERGAYVERSQEAHGQVRRHCDYEALPAMVTKVLESIPEDSLKAVEDAARARKLRVR